MLLTCRSLAQMTPDLEVPDSLALDTLEFEPDNFGIYTSSGWLPTPVPGHFSLGITLTNSYMLDLADNMMSRSFQKVKFNYSGRIPVDHESRMMKKAFTDVNDNEKYAQRGATQVGFDCKYSFPFPCIIRPEISLNWQSGMLWTPIDRKQYLNLEGNLAAVDEVTAIYIDEFLIHGGLDLAIPVYGGFIDSDDMTMQSYYYLFGGINAAYALSSSGYQFAQITQNKSELRYSNGRDTINIQADQVFSTIRRSRINFNIGLGWEFEASGIGLYFEIFYTSGLESILDDALWKQSSVNLRIGLDWLGFLKL